jgi:hypothetical protein
MAILAKSVWPARMAHAWPDVTMLLLNIPMIDIGSYDFGLQTLNKCKKFECATAAKPKFLSRGR